MQIANVCTGLATNAATIAKLNTYDHLPHGIDEPAFVIVDIEVTYDQAYNRCADQLRITCGVLLNQVDTPLRAAELYVYASPGPLSVKDALESDPDLGGACNDLTVTTGRIPRVITVGNTAYWAAEFIVDIEGDGS